MTIELLLSIVGAAAAILTGYWGLARLLIAQIERRLDDRFAAHAETERSYIRQSEERWKYIEEASRKQERELLMLKAELPREYVNRTDYLRRETIIEGKIDQLSLRIQNWILEGRNG